ncbi:hypothetical protein AR457_23460 [Streptomyces agglomeratus]|uniref:DUF4287 domain-containing protein n=1 Tax=Streptomyces agglomeratus TaxID=285458 RepID=A0A1E5PJD8_9ACTN|nr:hypothetical protein AS594_23345 [Streptomyces agglomeratus]OEJ42336.1 hypothetical protein BGK70_13195 [Streptomyces agglomeratus]OEJ49156.1 hypothetical protein AR457_23460 [Streptomyces agglomeratus]OEJ55649.1 hypothetical protein BGK72_12665 [Streptomyces agglomeratus]OEJ63034.1 hypothetical protein BGM19_13765 [Streptomyces agglomeratus]
MSADVLKASTGRDWDGWFVLLDAWGAIERGHTEIARHLTDDLGVDGWYAQSITVGYEQERGLREVGQSSQGDWQASGNRTVEAPVARCEAAFTDADVRRRWLPGSEFSLRTHREGKTLSADYAGGRLSVRFTPKGGAKTQVSLEHTKLADAEAVAAYKAFWKERLAALKTLLEK